MLRLAENCRYRFLVPALLVFGAILAIHTFLLLPAGVELGSPALDGLFRFHVVENVVAGALALVLLAAKTSGVKADWQRKALMRPATA